MLNNLIQKWNIKITIGFAVIGFIVSLLIVIIKGADFSEIILRPLFSGIIMAIFWNLSYFLVKKLVPDFTNEMENTFLKSNNAEPENTTTAEMFDDSGDFNFEQDKIENDFNLEDGDDLVKNNSDKISEEINVVESAAQQKTTKRKMKAGSDEILVQGIAIKKDPELMARTIQHVLDTDKD